MKWLVITVTMWGLIPGLLNIRYLLHCIGIKYLLVGTAESGLGPCLGETKIRGTILALVAAWELGMNFSKENDNYKVYEGKFMILLATATPSWFSLIPSSSSPYSLLSSISPSSTHRPVQTCCPTRSSSRWACHLSPGRRPFLRKFLAPGP